MGCPEEVRWVCLLILSQHLHMALNSKDKVTCRKLQKQRNRMTYKKYMCFYLFTAVNRLNRKGRDENRGVPHISMSGKQYSCPDISHFLTP